MWTGGIPWIGYDSVDKKLVVNPAEAEQVKTIFKKYLELGSVVELARHLKSVGIFNKKWTAQNGKIKGGNPISVMSLHRILREKVYIGQIEHKRNKTVAEGEHPAIISRELFDAVAEKLSAISNGKSGRTNASPNILSGKLYTADGAKFINSITKKSIGNRRPLYYYAARKNYIRTNDIDPLAQGIITELLNADLSALPADIAHVLKQINFDTLDYTMRRNLIRDLIDRAIVSDKIITFFIKPDPITLNKYTTNEFINQRADPIQFIVNSDTIIIKRDVVITKGQQLTKYNTGRRGLMTLTENNHLIVRAFATAWQHRQHYEEYGSIRELMRNKKTSDRTAQRYLNLAYMDPRQVNNIMSGKQKITIEELFKIASCANTLLNT
jgi:DNA invertase Pin-like site-specific DNA recombinase